MQKLIALRVGLGEVSSKHMQAQMSVEDHRLQKRKGVKQKVKRCKKH